ncbi:hypothetical protein [Bradyrhizobium sp. SYSU BS000235]|uniref:hypothetical protein n=1 Tax=Bradyrhizobium sp. SYSU BS000235 TaxID=3411332 RepID=UPI003C76D580
MSAGLTLAAMGVVAMTLGGCASAGSSMFVDPAKYSLYNCQQLATARASANTRVVELERLMAKAETGAAGGLVSGLAYQSDYVTARAQRDQIDEKMAHDNCSATSAPAVTTTPAAPAEPPAKRRR